MHVERGKGYFSQRGFGPLRYALSGEAGQLGVREAQLMKPGFTVKPLDKLGFTVKPLTKLGFTNARLMKLVELNGRHSRNLT